jgi:catechol 2,3-dioxygenase-like lactoylglutathione lyase family enzyme
VRGVTPIARFQLVALDCPDPQRLAAFYAEITGMPVAQDDGDWVELDGGGGPTIAFQRAPDHRPPAWPDPEHPQQAHLDLQVADLDEGERAVLAVGAQKAAVQPAESFRVFIDPAGHPFCLVTGGPGS